MRGVAVLAAAIGLAGCAAVPIEVPQASVAAIRSISAANIPPMAVGGFVPAPELPRGADTEIRLRAEGIKPPNGRSFAAYMGETLAEQLRVVGKLDPASRYTLSGVLLENRTNPAIGKANGSLAFRFRLDRDGMAVFDKRFDVRETWNSSFIGALAIPEAEKHYTALYPRLIELLMADPEFRAAVTR